jgi:hypothetical protein
VIPFLFFFHFRFIILIFPTSISSISTPNSVNSTNQVLLKSGSITSGNIQSGSYTIQGTETVDNLCNTSVPTTITINGQCGTGVTINFRAANGETATFTGNVKCVSS